MAYTAIDDPSAYFKVQLYTGTGSSHAITFNDTDTDMSPNLVWAKSRSNGSSHTLCDAVRGVTEDLYSESTAAEYTNSTGLTAFGSDGFTVGSDNGWNGSSRTFVAWCWKESADAGFDIVTYTGTGSARTVSHSLSAVPHFLTVKKRDGTGGWSTGHHSLAWTNEVQLQSNDPVGASTPAFNDTDPTSSVFTLGSGANGNSDTDAFVGYVWSEKQGYSKFSSFVGNGADDGTFCFTGHRPAMVFLKGTASNREWIIFDAKRDPSNPIDGNHNINTADTENTGTARIDFLSNGFKLRDAANNYNADGETYIYASFAEAPFVNSNGVPCNAR